MSLVRKFDGTTAEFRDGVGAGWAELPRESTDLLLRQASSLRKVFKRIDRAKTQLDYCDLATSSLPAAAQRCREAFVALRRKQAGAFAGLEALVDDALDDIARLLRSIDARVSDPTQLEIERLTLMTTPLLMFEEQRKQTVILDPEQLGEWAVRIELRPTRATLAWLDQAQKKRREGLRDAILAGLEPVRRDATELVFAAEQAMSSEGPTAREDRLDKLALRLPEYRQDARRAANKAARRWFRRQVKLDAVRERYPLGAESVWRRGKTVFLEQVADASETLAYELRMYGREVKWLDEELGKDMVGKRKRLARPLPDFYDTAVAALEIIREEAGDRSPMGMLRGLASRISSDIAASFSSADEALAKIRDDGKRLDSELDKVARLIDDGPSHLYQAKLRWARMPPLAKAAQLDKKTCKRIDELPGWWLATDRLVDELIERYDELIELVDDLISWARRNEGVDPNDLRDDVLEDYVEALAPFATDEFLAKNDQLARLTKKWAEALTKIPID